MGVFMKLLLLMAMFCFSSFAFSATIERDTEIYLKSQEGVEVVVDFYQNTFFPYDWKYYSLTMASRLRVRVRGDFGATDKVRMVLINKIEQCMAEDYICRGGEKVLELDLAWDSSNQQFVYQQPLIFAYSQDSAIWLDTAFCSYSQEIAFVINGEWLVDPINKTSNFQLVY